MIKSRYQKYIQQQRLKNTNSPCENCGKEHDHSYGTGRFCSKICRDTFVGKRNHLNKSPKVKAHLDKLRAEGKLYNKAKYGTWTCSVCNEVCNTRAELNEHYKQMHGKNPSTSRPVMNGGMFGCEYCGKFFKSKLSWMAHLIHCTKHPNKEVHDKTLKKQRETWAKRYKAGLYKKVKGHPVSEETKRRIMQTFEERCSRGDYAGKYKGYYFESSFELAWIVYNLDHGISFERCTETFEYYDSGTNKWRTYFPDFILPDGTIVEIKGYYTQNDTDKMQAVIFDYGRDIVLLMKKDLATQLDYCRKKYGKDFVKTLKDPSKAV